MTENQSELKVYHINSPQFEAQKNPALAGFSASQNILEVILKFLKAMLGWLPIHGCRGLFSRQTGCSHTIGSGC